MNTDQPQPIHLTSKILQTLNPADVIYAEFAGFGAMGACGTARIFALENEKMNFYLTGDTYHNQDDINSLNQTIEYLIKLEKTGVLDRADGGFGNTAFKKHDIIFTRDDDNYSLIYEDSNQKYAIPTSVVGVYTHIVAQFTTRKVSIEDLENYYKTYRPETDCPETDFYESYLEQLKRFDTGADWFDFSPLDYYNAINYLKHETDQEYILSEADQATGRKALQRYKLQYVIRKLGWNKTNDIFAQLVKDKSFAVFAKINTALDKKIENVYSELGTKEFSSYKISRTITDSASLHEYYHDFSQLFSEPLLINFTPEERQKIRNDLLKLNGSSLRAGTYGFYLANYILNEDKFPYADILPTIAHIVRHLPFDDFNHTHNEDFFYLCGEIVDRSWRYLPDETTVQKHFRDFIYDIYWSRIESLWPIVHRNKIDFKNPITGQMFDDATSFVMCLIDIDKRNTEVKTYFEQTSKSIDSVDYLTPLGRSVFCYSLRPLSPEQEFQTILTKIQPWHWSQFLSRPETVEEAKILLTELFNTGKTAKITEYYRLSVLESLLMTANANDVGSYILSYIHDNFAKLTQIISLENEEDPKTILSDLFIAACKGISEANELEPLSRLKTDLISYGCPKKKLDSAEQSAKHHQKTISFQRQKLTPLFFNYPLTDRKTIKS